MGANGHWNLDCLIEGTAGEVSLSAICCAQHLTLYSLVNVMMATTEGGRARKGKNFSADEEQQVCRSFLHISQDPRTSNGQRAAAFWERVCKHYHENRPLGAGERPSRSLETKWGVVKHDVAKFCGVFKSVLACRESGTSLDDILERALDLYKQKHPKQQPFVFVHCSRILKDIPRWSDSILLGNPQSQGFPCAMAKRKSSGMPQQRSSQSGTDALGSNTADVEVLAESPSASKRLARPQGQKAAKEVDRLQRQREIAIRAQARATADLAAANLQKAQVLQDQAVLSLFTMPNEEHLSALAREYLNLRREEEMLKLRNRLAVEREGERHLRAEGCEVADETVAEVQVAQQQRNILHPLLRPQSPPLVPSPSPDQHSPVQSEDHHRHGFHGNKGHNHDGAGAYEEGMGTQGTGYSDPLHFESDAVVSETQYSQPQPHFHTQIGSPPTFHTVGGYYKAGNDSCNTQQTNVQERQREVGLNLNSHFYFQ